MSSTPTLADDVVGQACFRTENDCIGGPTSAEDQDGHGTHVAGIITGPQGVAPDATIYALKVFTTADTSDTNILNALNHVIGLNTATPGTVDVINMSLGGGNFADQASVGAIGSLALAAPGGLSIQSSTSNSVSLQWDPVAAATQYRVYVSVDGGPPAAVGTVTAGTTTFTHTPTACGPLSYTVRSIDGAFESLPSNAVAITTRACPVAPTGLALSVTGSGRPTTLSWSDTNVDETSDGPAALRRWGRLRRSRRRSRPAPAFQRTESALSCGMHRYRAIAVRDGDRSAPSNTVSRSICAPSNDDIAAAEAGHARCGRHDGDRHGAECRPTPPRRRRTRSSAATSGAPAAGYNSVWYRITPATDTRVTISTAATTVFAPDRRRSRHAHRRAHRHARQPRPSTAATTTSAEPTSGRRWRGT